VVLVKCGSARARAPLQHALSHDSDWRVRRASAEALGLVGDVSVVESLIAALKDDDWLVRETAAKALGRICDEKAVEPLIEAMEGNWPALWTVAEALGQHGDARAVRSLTTAIQASNEDKYVRDAAVEALGLIGEPIQESLVAVLRTQDEASRQRAIEALGQMRDARNLTPLIEALRHGEPYHVHHGAMQALIRLGETAVDPLVEVLSNSSDYDAFARQRAANALGQIGDRRGVQALIDALSDPASIVRKQAHESLSLFNLPEAKAAIHRQAGVVE
jgi:HEAT repeat protein